MRELNIIYVGVEFAFKFNLFDAFAITVVNLSDIYLNGIFFTHLFEVIVCSVLDFRISLALQDQVKMALFQCVVSRLLAM
jgi:hypothetical protein